MRGKKKLVQSMVLISMTGALALTATFSQPQTMQTEENIQIDQVRTVASNGTAGIISAFSENGQLSGIQMIQALSVETDKYDAGTLDDEGNLVRDITYVYPERRCPKCGKKIDEVEVNPDNLLFTRHQLGLMKKI